MVAAARERRAGEARGRRGACVTARPPKAWSRVPARRRSSKRSRTYCRAARSARSGRTYGGFAAAFAAAGGRVVEAKRLEDMERLDVAIVVNPNNPDGRIIPRGELLDLHERLARRGALLIVDEAFADFDGEEKPCVGAARERRGRLALVRQGLRAGRASSRFRARFAGHRSALAGRAGPVAGQRAGDRDRGSGARRFGLARGDARAPRQGQSAARRAPARRGLANHRRNAPLSAGRACRRARRL